jgi:cell division septation protein DedD
VFGTIPVPSLAPPAQVYLQISSSQNPAWARELARQLVSAGYPALVRDPSAAEDGYRVVLGPYSSREVAEQAGRQLGRPFFVLTEPLSSIPR